MKTLILSISTTLLLSLTTYGQIYYTPIDVSKYTTVSRNVYINYFSDAKELIIVDYKEGITMACDSIAKDPNDTHVNTAYDRPLFFEKVWKLYDDLMDVGIQIYLPEGQNLDSWEEMISIQRIDAQGQSSKKLFNNLMKEREKNCPNNTSSKILVETKNSVVYQAITEPCGAFDFQAEWTVILSPPKLTMFQYTLWKIEYVVKNKEWEHFMTRDKLDWLKTITLYSGKALQNYIDIH